MLPNKIVSVDFDFYDTSIHSVLASHTLKVTSLRHPFEMVFFNQPSDISIGGQRRSNVRGFDAKLEFEWEDVRNQESAIINFINNISNYASWGSVKLRFNVTGGTDYIYVVPNQVSFSQDYINQIKRTPTVMSFELDSYRDEIDYD